MQQHCQLTHEIDGAKLQLFRGDITEHEVDAIVNAANARLAGGGGVDGAIHAAGGPSIMVECRRLKGCPVGQAVVTGAGRLKAKYVIHTVGPIWTGGDHNEDDLLRSAYLQSLRQAAEHMCRHVAFPSISTGAYGFPIKRAARIAIQAVADFLRSSSSMESVRFVLFTQDDLDVYDDAVTDLLVRPKLGCWFEYFQERPERFYHLLTLRPSQEMYAECVSELKELSRRSSWEQDTIRLLSERNWRALLPASVAIYLNDPDSRTSAFIDAIWRAVETHTWVAPQLLCVLSEIDPEFGRNARALLASEWQSGVEIDAAYVGKVANSLLALHELQSWQIEEDVAAYLRELSDQDTDSADRIVKEWLPRLRALRRCERSF